MEELIAELAHIQEEYIPLGAEDRKAFFERIIQVQALLGGDVQEV